jgi:hypothetical protein
MKTYEVTIYSPITCCAYEYIDAETPEEASAIALNMDVRDVDWVHYDDPVDMEVVSVEEYTEESN